MQLAFDHNCVTVPLVVESMLPVAASHLHKADVLFRLILVQPKRDATTIASSSPPPPLLLRQCHPS